MISRKERTTREVAGWLEGEGATQPEVDWVVARLGDLGLLDDSRFALLYAEDKRRISGWGRDRIERVLLERGIPGDVVREALATEGDGEISRAIGVLSEREFDLEDSKERQRALGLLARRGFGSDDAYGAIREARKRQAMSPAGSSLGPEGLASGGLGSR